MKDALGNEIRWGDRLAVGGSGSGRLYFATFEGESGTDYYGRTKYVVRRESDGKVHDMTGYDLKERAVSLSWVARNP